MLILLDHGRDNVLRPERERDFVDFNDFAAWLQTQGHELRGPSAPVTDEADLKTGLAGASRPSACIPMLVDWDRPVGDEEADARFLDRHGPSTDYRRRSKGAFEASPSWIWLDLDDLSQEEWRDLLDELVERELNAIAYSSWGHGSKPNAVKCRLILEADREYLPSEVRRVRLGTGKLLGVRVDRSCTDASRLFYLPACPPWRADKKWFWRSKGASRVSVDETLAASPEGAGEVLERLELAAGPWLGGSASDEHRAVAEEAVERWCDQISRQAGGSFRSFTTQRAFRIGHFVGSGCLDPAATEERMRAAYLLARERWGDDQPIAYRFGQLRKGLEDGRRRPRFPLSFAALREVEEAGERAEVVELRELLEAQRPAEEITLGGARARSLQHLSRGTYDALTIDASSVGAGKSFLLAKVAANRAREGRLTVIQTQAHAVAAQTRAELHRQHPEVRSAHLFSPASAPAGEAGCPRFADDPELRELVRDFGTPLRRICATSCSLAESCPALAAARERDFQASRASVLFVSQAGVSQAGDFLDAGAALFTDEAPEPLEGSLVSAETVAKVLAGGRIPGVGAEDADALRGALRALADDLPDSDYKGLPPPPAGALRALEAAEKAFLKEVSKLSRILASGAAFFLANGAVEGHSETASWAAMLAARESVLVDATPPWYALPANADVLRQAVADPEGVKITREMIFLGRAGTGALCPSEGQIAERAVEAALARARTLPGKVLFVTFPAIRRWIEAEGRWPAGALAHFGATRGRNDWQDFESCYCLGTPRYAREPGLKALLRKEDVAREWAYLAQAELEQALGRLRHVSAKRDLRMVVEGNLPPLSFHAGNTKIVRARDFGVDFG